MITNVKYLSDDKYTNYAVSIIYDNDTSKSIQTLVDKTNNRHWQQVQEWVEDGNTIQEAD
tara:strand:+ start:385 stop:564 length:180 start_codon:yes stop_codon:yes gene_type:complete